ncbi:Ribosomal large subunit pseudouridine synthase A [Marinobacterium lacunae]|uniref:Dual-specificity RNA pseudouridine synthase RluA n=1 Tax=Marinobacterium lacunae TaxID=1232683 RepID=A0A081FU36_9GAMM|nr:RluA family pseudouridine synthase [Marinobacterium lacunae]KEA62041.1 Ribosomal large subunit pseudouridine synthase A [Marinobacterium lacunae]
MLEIKPSCPEVLYSDDDILVVSKPANLLSVPGKGPDKQDCLWKRAQRSHPTARIVHRLDYATSGLMVLALTAESHRALSIQFQERQTDKRYQAIVHGAPDQEKGEINLPLRCDWENRPLQIVDHVQGKNALTRWHRLETNDLGTRVLLYPVTGRSHQLRVHLQAIGHPILGDAFYAPESVQNLSTRLLLHAEYLSLNHPATGQRMAFSSLCPF